MKRAGTGHWNSNPSIDGRGRRRPAHPTPTGLWRPLPGEVYTKGQPRRSLVGSRERHALVPLNDAVGSAVRDGRALPCSPDDPLKHRFYSFPPMSLLFDHGGTIGKTEATRDFFLIGYARW